MQASLRPTPMSGAHLGQPRLALLRCDGRQRPPVGERRHGGDGGGDLRSRHHQVELGQLGGIVGDVSSGQRRRGVLRVVLQEDNVMGHHRGRGQLCGHQLTFSKGVCLAFRPFSLPTLAGRQPRFSELCEPPPSRPCRVPGSLWKVSALFSAILKEKALTLTRHPFRRRGAVSDGAPDFPEVGVPQGRVRGDALVRVVGQHLVEQREGWSRAFGD